MKNPTSGDFSVMLNSVYAAQHPHHFVYRGYEGKLKELTNQTTRDFIRNIRLKQAAELLSKKRYTIAEVADLTGFTNPNNFSTAFKDLYGMPPSIYMEQHLKQDKNKEEN